LKQAVVVIHGMGEQVPMQTLSTFVDAVWTHDKSLIAANRPDAETGGERTINKSWGKPDRRNRSFELRRITTEKTDGGYNTDFYEYYWAHLMHGTTFEHVRGWIMGLLLRNPVTRVPPSVRLAWVALWIVSIILLAFAIDSIVADSGPESPLGRLFKAAIAVIGGWFVSSVLVKRFGDVARYVKPLPVNVARRQEIREKGVELLEGLLREVDEDDKPVYDRVIVVAHSLGTIVAYDILTHTWARMNDALPVTTKAKMKQPARAKLEHLIQSAAGLPVGEGAAQEEWSIDAFQAAQESAAKELAAQGHPWRVTDFVTLGSPLTHAEFLMAEDLDDLRAQQMRRVLPTCPPIPERDRKTGLHHVGYRTGPIARIGDGSSLEDPRIPHHAALFAYTKWTNLFSPHEFIIKGDIVSGPVGEQFGMPINDRVVSGVRDIAVLEDGFATHNCYWSLTRDSDDAATPEHLIALRDALNLGAKAT